MRDLLQPHSRYRSFVLKLLCSVLPSLLQVCRSLFEKEKLLFAFLMTVHLKAHIQKTLDWSQLRFLLTGAGGQLLCWVYAPQQSLLHVCSGCNTAICLYVCTRIMKAVLVMFVFVGWCCRRHRQL
jgi:hypothetical protein